MKKLKLLTPVLGVAALAGSVTAISSCACTSDADISLDCSKISLKVGQSITLKAYVSQDLFITWYSSDENVATVNEGLVMAKTHGVTTITARAGSKTATCKVSVTSDPSPSQEDKDYLTEINDLMVYGKEYSSPHNVIQSLKNNGYDVVNHKLSSTKLEFAFDASVKKFIIMNDDDVSVAPSGYEMTNSQVVFKFTNSYNKDSKYGQYLLDEYVWEDPYEKFEINASIDVGSNTNIKNMWYVGSSSNGSSTKLVRTYCEYLRFDANNDNIFHMGESNNIEVYGVSSTKVCNYMEFGKTAYLYAENAVLQLAKLTTADAAQIDVLEAGENVTKGELFHPEFITMLLGTIPESGKTSTEVTEVNTADKLYDAIIDNKKFIRLTDDIILTASSPIDIVDKTYILDLGGFDLIDNSTVTAGDALINIQASDEDSELILLDSYRSGTLKLNDHYISIEGNKNTSEKCRASLYLEGANIEYNSTTERNGAIVAGGTNTTSYGQQYSRVYMYGGVINANTDSVTHTTEVAGIYANNDALIQVIYGAIYSSTNCVRTNGIYSGSVIDISDGTFKNDNDTFGECIYLPQGKLTISGGTFIGHTCLGIRGGSTIISGGYFHAVGEQQDYDKQDAGSGIGGDGSVICVKLCNGSGPNTYGTTVNLNIYNATLQSDNSYIFHLFRNDSTVAIDQQLDVNFGNGVYYYGYESTSPISAFSGMRISSEVPEDVYRIYQRGGSWIKI